MIVLDTRIAGNYEYAIVPEESRIALAFIPPKLPMSVVFLGYPDGTGTFQVAGSAFWVINVQKDEDLKKDYRPAYLVTAGHVIRDLEEKKLTNRVWLRANLRRNGTDWFPAGNLEDWKDHSDTSVDLSILKLGIESAWDHFGWPTDGFVTEESTKIDEKEIEAGDEVFSAGLFWPRIGKSRNIPIVRVGNIAAARQEKIELKQGVFSDLYLMEVRSIGGLSGSPVFIDIVGNKADRKEAGNIHVGPARFRLLGVISGHFNGLDTERESKAVPEPQLEKLNTGIAWVTPAEKIISGLEHFVEREKEEIEEYRRKKFVFVSPDSRPTVNVAAQMTSSGFEIPVPTEDNFLRDLGKASRKKDQS